jgi:hypothetical protein
MAAMTTALTEFATNGDSRTYVLTDHSVLKPKLVVQKRRVPAGTQTVSDTTVSVVFGTEDSDGLALASKVAFSANVRMPIHGQAADRDACLAVFRDIIASDEFSVAVSGQFFLKT